uniref:Thymus-specific serine protease n=1 Tax=Paramoeba aestuarina TaxID=180227 RepID=A0A7S4KRF4_9EUKA|eukprot:CAMPEP_0201509930 /NCGR_PEP_ID=MMETSP0161_2-20130828/2835_1 /ASSEMBLY_ACC=CAM_ASM_000251 /TAXON_ID=180227 /ORGANISM="Neoparamoeba aestuarina, Strain SoJaBio B1-5/56/2" /LENGTH=478 /DNA_ID=CAMNT_0047905027 /DNA_START=55 /DNA_END=1491 /DNA_ORIENTATION=-
MKSFILLLVVSVVVVVANNNNNNQLDNNKKFELLKTFVDAGAGQNDLGPWYNTFTQIQDHSDPSNTNTFQQRFSVKTQFYKKGGPLFFFLSGESAMELYNTEVFANTDLPREFGAMFVVLEHRFYGESFPTSTLATENLALLTSQQALADAAHFLTDFQNKMGFSPNQTVVFGCSYSGALSAWFREKYSDLVVGSIAPSSPVEAILNFTGFYGLFEQAASGFPGCSYRIQQAIGNISSLLTTTDGRKSLQSTFNLCTPLAEDGNDDYHFKHMLTLIVGTAPQYENPPGWALTNTCEIMNNDDLSAIDAYAQAVVYNKPPLKALGCYEWSQKAYIKALRNEKIESHPAIGRAWYWQKCNEFGYFQTTYPGTSIFFDDLDLEHLLHDCQAAYGIEGKTPDVDGTNSYYGGKDIQTHNIQVTNGNYDPWHLLSITTPTSYISSNNYEAAHCAALHAITKEDPPSLIAARNAIRTSIATWLK